jgi:peptidoglycan-associated lipoprotein
LPPFEEEFHMNHIARSLTLLALTGLLAACPSSPIKKEEGAPVSEAETRKPEPATTTTQVPDPRDVKGVQLPDDLLNAAGPLRDRVIYFDYDSFAIQEQYVSVVNRHSSYLVKGPGAVRKVFVEGHADQRGSREYNLSLGQKRAEAVKSAMKLQGVPEDRIEAVSYGKEKPADPAMTEAAFAKNRRAELNYRLQ